MHMHSSSNRQSGATYDEAYDVMQMRMSKWWDEKKMEMVKEKKKKMVHLHVNRETEWMARVQLWRSPVAVMIDNRLPRVELQFFAHRLGQQLRSKDGHVH